MAFNVMSFVVGRMIAEREGVPADRVNRVALIPAVLGASSVVGLVIAQQIARREVPPAPAPAAPAGDEFKKAADRTAPKKRRGPKSLARRASATATKAE